jgi:hypothetical protein
MFPVQFGVQMKDRSGHCAHIADQLHFWAYPGLLFLNPVMEELPTNLQLLGM